MQYLKHTLFGAGLAAVVAVAGVSVSGATADETPAALTLEAVNDHSVRAANTCATTNTDYMESLQTQDGTDVLFAGCGGLL